MKALMSIAMMPFGLALAVPACAADRNAPVLAQNTPQVCTEIYQPVCGTLNGKRVTYSNACFARAAKATDVKPGECPK